MQITARHPGIHVEHLWLADRHGGHLLADVTFDVAPGELTVIAGPSGAGKTTLLRSLAGLVIPTNGSVSFDSGDARSSEPRIGYVPQEDILHRDLALGETLRYAARLRLGESARDVVEVVDRVVRTLGLEQRLDVRIRDLSGGQRKRASIAVELLAGPQWLLLDEPTSGLDPLNAASVTDCLRSLADSGVTVVATSHDPAQLEEADRLVLLAPGGRLAFAGSPDEARSAFGVSRLDDVYGRLEGLPPLEVTPPARPQPLTRPRPNRAPRHRPIRRWWVLTRRTAALMGANRLTLAVLLGSPTLVIAMMAVLFAPGSFAPTTASATTGPQILFWIAFAGFFFGLTYGLLQVVSERDIQRRELVSGIGTGMYVGAKLAVLLPILSLINGVLLAVMVGTDRLPSMSAAAFASLLLTLVLESTAAATLGLLASAAVSDTAQAALALPMLCFPQVLFGGAIVPIDRIAGPGRAISLVLANRWAFEALGRSIPSASVTSSVARVYPRVFAGSPVEAWLILLVSTAAALTLLSRLLKR